VNDGRTWKAFSLMMCEKSCGKDDWIVDSGASSHLCNDRSKFGRFWESQIKTIGLANGEECIVGGEGLVLLETLDLDGKTVKLKLSNVIYVPDLKMNLLSVGKLVDKGVAVTFDGSGCILAINKEIIGVANHTKVRFKLRLAREKSFFARMSQK
jgi:hypothetical protein